MVARGMGLGQANHRNQVVMEGVVTRGTFALDCHVHP